MKTIFKSILFMLAATSIVYGMLVYTDNKVITAYADNYRISKDNIYALTHKWDKCPEEYSAYFDDVMGICWNDSAVSEQANNFNNTDIGM